GEGVGAIGDGRGEHGLQALKGMASGHQKPGRLHMAEIFVGEYQPNAGSGAGGPRVESNNAPFPYGRSGERCMEDIGSRVVGTEQNRTADLVRSVAPRDIGKWRIAHRRQALCPAIIKASATVPTPSSILKRLSPLGLAPCNAASLAARAARAVSGRPTNVCSALRARHGVVATPPTAMRTSRTVSASICKATAAEARAKAKDSRS